jgi:hypothetical protein
MEIMLHTFFISVPGGGELSCSPTSHFIPEEITCNIHWMEGWVTPRFGLDVVTEKIPNNDKQKDQICA